MPSALTKRLLPAAAATLAGPLLALGLFSGIALLAQSREQAPSSESPLIINIEQWQSEPPPPAPPPPKPKPPPPKPPKPKPKPPEPEPPPPEVSEFAAETVVEPPAPEPEPEPQPEPPPRPQPPKEALPTPVPIFKLSAMPRFLHQEAARYPESMRAGGNSGTVRLEALIDDAGRVREVTILESAGEAFDEAAREAILASSFVPAEVDGKKVAVRLRLPVRFQLR